MLELIANNLSLLGCLSLLWVIAIGAGAISVRRYSGVINPVTGAIVSQAAITCLLSSAASCFSFTGLLHSEHSLKLVILISSLFLCAVVAGASVRICAVENSLSWVLCRQRAITGVLKPAFASSLLLLSSFVLWVAVAIRGGGGMLWLEDPRSAYLSFRSGVGLLWAASGWALIVALTIAIYRARSGSARVVVTVFCCLLGFWLGSKAVSLGIVAVAIVHQHLCVRPINLGSWLVWGGIFAVLFGLLISVQAVDGSSVSSASYLAEYSTTAARGLELLGSEGGWFSGSAWVTSMWEYVPRSVVPEKPFVYGRVLLNEELNPGMAELGHTPGSPAWILGFMEAGLVGVVASGVIAGQLHSAAFHVFTRRLAGPADLLLLIQLGVFPVLSYSSLVSNIGIYFLVRCLVGDVASASVGASSRSCRL